MSFPLLQIVYPQFTRMIKVVRYLDVKSRSLLIKVFQAQHWPSLEEDTTLRSLLENYGDIVIPDCCDGLLVSVPLVDLPSQVTLDLTILNCSIYIDICRSVDLPNHEVDAAILDGWSKELRLSEEVERPSAVDWRPIFEWPSFGHLPIHPNLPPNPEMYRRLHRSLSTFRNSLKDHMFYPRGTHKNMSRDTRRNYEKEFESLDGVPIFGQDNWQRVYHETGRQLPGVSEMRQKWYPSGAKPRTYFAMGGSSYAASRFLQDFFSQFVDWFIPTNSIHRLRPSRLYASSIERDDPHFRIYDLASFTSNCHEQTSFCVALREFMDGIDITIVDERDGPVVISLYSLLDTYIDVCVSKPALSYERFDPELEGRVFHHGRASLLGIYGNLMTCTVLHFFIMSTVSQTLEEINVAGDDGIVVEDSLNNLDVDTAISLIGEYARDKTFRGDEAGAICLKRPFWEELPLCNIGFALTPPNASMALSLVGYEDSRFSFFGHEDLSLSERIAMIGKDLLRFLTTAYLRQYDDVEELSWIVRGFRRLLQKKFGRAIHPGLHSSFGHATWPIDPLDYDFHECSPYMALAVYFSPPAITVPRWESINADTSILLFTGDQVVSNLDKRISLLEKLGYVTTEPVMRDLEEHETLAYWAWRMNPFRRRSPGVYTINVVKDIPAVFLF
jgi:hypothetical protein